MAVEASRDPALQLDQAARTGALDVQGSLLLQAPAGSGKTTVLTARFLVLLASVDAPEEILAVTFTRKAAAQMRHRILAALQVADGGGSVPGIDAGLLQAALARDRERGWNLLLNPARLRIQTIDALNHFLASQLPVSARCGARLDLAASPQVLYQRAARQTLEEAWDDPQLKDAAEQVFERLDGSWRRLEALLVDMLARRTHWLPRVLVAPQPQEPGAPPPDALAQLAARVQDSLTALVTAQLAQVLARWPAPLRAEGCALAAHAARILDQQPDATAKPGAEAWLVDDTALRAQPEDLPRWCFLCALALTTKGDWRQRHTRREGFDAADKPMKARLQAWMRAMSAQPQLAPQLAALAQLPGPLTDADRAALGALARLLHHAAAQLLLVFAASGQVDYAYVAAAARMSLTEAGEPTDLALRLGTRLRHILVDEFQDTSYEQFHLLQALTAGWEPGDGRTLFVVGDPMQSIYQFREAEVGLFLRARDHGVGALALQALQLRRNFRSVPALVAWLNQCFTQLFPPADDARLAAIRYLPSISGVDAPGGVVSLHCFQTDEQRSHLDAEAQRAVQIVRAARARKPDATVAVLVASRRHASAIVPALQQAGFALRGVELEQLNERAVVRDLAAVTRALLHAADRTAWLALLRAPWCGLTLAQLDELAAMPADTLYEAMGTAAATATDARLQQSLRRVVQALAPAIGGAERAEPLWRRVEHCWLRLGGPASCADERDLTDAYAFLDALASHDDPARLVGAGLDELTTPLHSAAVATAGAIDVMTMHSAKGLEWDVVLLPGLGLGTRRDSDPLLHWIELPREPAGTDLLLAPIRATEREPAGSLPAYIKQWRRRRAQLERVRLLYVAATRAREALHLLGAVRPATATTPAAPVRGSLLDVLWPATGAGFLQSLAQGGTAAADAVDAVPVAVATGQPPLRRFVAGWMPASPPPAPPIVQLSAMLRTANEQRPEYSWVGLTARAVGTVVHAELNRLAGGSGTIAALAHYVGWLADLGVGVPEREAAALQVHSALARTLADPRGRWLLDAAHRDARSELRLSGLLGGRIVNLVLDRTFIDDEQQRWIVDFKTSTHAGADREAFIASEVERYRGQLLGYAALARQLGPEPVRLALYFPLLGEFRPIEA